ncbi:diacylglycerol lipase-alpha-like [Clytia hemisphaerica]|uniref:sn-1-specific diacylglycerol lipase n=1 Tax=Clytia hemisphaerica TaxID=252671 RepID=A0A7M5UF85_9CNID
MPGLVVFNRRWVAASDELVIPFGLAFVFRLFWFLAVGTIFGVHYEIGHQNVPEDCNLHRSHIYFIIYLVLLLFSLANDAAVAIVSSCGTIFDKTSRRKIPSLLYFRSFILFIEACVSGLGIYYVFYKSRHCFRGYDAVLSKLVVIFNIVWVLGCLVLIWFTYDPAGSIWFELQMRSHNKKASKYQSVETIDVENRIYEKNEKYWSRACRLLFCCTKAENSRDNVLLFASKLFTNYFRNYHDLVPSDILAGMILLRQKQKYEEFKRIQHELKHTDSSYQEVTIHKKFKTVRRHQKTINAIPFDNNSPEDKKILDDITYFANYALASYGWPMYCFLNKIPICKKEGCMLLNQVTCCYPCCPCSEPPKTHGDNCCLCNLAAQKTILKMNNDHFIYVSYESVVFKTPFTVVVDNTRNAIVISCRGTLSLHDILTDLAIEEVSLPGCDEKWTAHKGFFEAATAIKAIIDEKDLIKQAQNFDVDKGTQNYKLVIVGHSLGGGTATLLAFLLKPEYPDLLCYAYAPPGATVNYEASNYARSFIHSVILGKDMIGRMNYYTLNELQHNIVKLLERTKLPKWRILRGCMCQCVLCCTHADARSFDEYFDSEDEIEIDEFDRPDINKLYMAGKVVHICKIRSVYPSCGSKKGEYKAFWSTPEDFQNILISNLMLRDHYPDALINALGSLLSLDEEEYVINATGSPTEQGSASINIDLSGLSDDLNPESEEPFLARPKLAVDETPLLEHPDGQTKPDPASPSILLTGSTKDILGPSTPVIT